MKRLRMKKTTEKGTRAIDHHDKEKQCKMCGLVYPLTSEYWHKNKQQSFGFHLYCKTCRNKKKKLKYREDQAVKMNKAKLKNKKND